jgi:hypothetical protein
VQWPDHRAACQCVVGRVRRLASAIHVEGDDGVDSPTIEPVDPLEVDLEELARRDLLRSQRGREFRCR